MIYCRGLYSTEDSTIVNETTVKTSGIISLGKKLPREMLRGETNEKRIQEWRRALCFLIFFDDFIGKGKIFIDDVFEGFDIVIERLA